MISFIVNELFRSGFTIYFNHFHRLFRVYVGLVPQAAEFDLISLTACSVSGISDWPVNGY